MRTLLLIHVFLSLAAALLLAAPKGAQSDVVDVFSSFEGWVQHIQDTCHPDPEEDGEDDDHLPSRPHQLTDEVFTKVLKAKKNSTLTNKHRNMVRRSLILVRRYCTTGSSMMMNLGTTFIIHTKAMVCIRRKDMGSLTRNSITIQAIQTQQTVYL
ncbi:hypothetical protein KP509_13G037100 [Ceratopteris richardii]|uniref:Uncharacterized protein n=1 Tax=Ceratopteris richardii TaxID=49495 RepID=A0A8T2TES2_CERRI|nr:hypothetical protein KP509_13G037100 [Ceratopteris richardii]